VSDASTDGWVPVEGVTEPDEVLELTDIATMREATHPVRGLILRRLKQPHTVAEVAEAMRVPVTRLYHHVNRLVDVGLIHVVATRQVAAVTERRYQVVARSFRLAHDVFGTLDRHELAKAIGSVFDLARIGLERLVESGGYTDVTDPTDHSVISLSELNLTEDERTDLLARLQALFTEFSNTTERPGTERLNLFVAAYPDVDAGADPT